MINFINVKMGRIFTTIRLLACSTLLFDVHHRLGASSAESERSVSPPLVMVSPKNGDELLTAENATINILIRPAFLHHTLRCTLICRSAAEGKRSSRYSLHRSWEVSLDGEARSATILCLRSRGIASVRQYGIPCPDVAYACSATHAPALSSPPTSPYPLPSPRRARCPRRRRTGPARCAAVRRAGPALRRHRGGCAT